MSSTPHIALVTRADDIEQCCEVLRELRPHIEAREFPAHVQRLVRSGYRLVAVHGPRGPVAVAGFRIGESLAWGRYLYVDDLVTLPSERSRGHGSALLDWLRRQAKADGCTQLHLDSGVARHAAHRFYAREGMSKAACHFVQDLHQAMMRGHGIGRAVHRMPGSRLPSPRSLAR